MRVCECFIRMYLSAVWTVRENRFASLKNVVSHSQTKLLFNSHVGSVRESKIFTRMIPIYLCLMACKRPYTRFLFFFWYREVKLLQLEVTPVNSEALSVNSYLAK